MLFFSIFNRRGKDLNDAEQILRSRVFPPEPKPVERPIREILRSPGEDISIFYQKKNPRVIKWVSFPS